MNNIDFLGHDDGICFVRQERLKSVSVPVKGFFNRVAGVSGNGCRDLWRQSSPVKQGCRLCTRKLHAALVGSNMALDLVIAIRHLCSVSNCGGFDGGTENQSGQPLSRRALCLGCIKFRISPGIFSQDTCV